MTGDELEVELVADGGPSADELRGLRRWLLDEPELRGRVSLREAPPLPGELGGRLDAVVVALRGSERSVAALDRGVRGWLAARAARQPAGREQGQFRLVARTAFGEFDLRTDAAGLADPAVRDLIATLTSRVKDPATGTTRVDAEGRVGTEGRVGAEHRVGTGAVPGEDGGPPSPVGSGLTAEEVTELAAVFGRPLDAVLLLRRAGLRPESFKAFDGMTAVAYWTEVGAELGFGRVEGGRHKLLAAAAAEYPGNPVFGRSPS
ncbi:hypothetical protein I6A84_25680 [Frankia sp. CNm7]|uniref:Effector-associated domain-containing protein n=1 Tax=Frankia nepalensis TaxID=1836974 RepID=A0A937RDU9_9ACTN|nr:effector-associated domain EAD1-containing protein [Frankia nepalensis]MBL7502100.1 hypothetical protein [Frankia nepalensis]MBL7514774.1 hypothetical protein [Frankia nepalensis]MBL7521380.1 hypothetical protein [Frankia nepalensis]MBL7628122.1 hypothetical protein [Frankia nepalensis]